jgi:GNAT superfamily N-acetyltransferase
VEVRGQSVRIRLAVEDDRSSIAPLLRQALDITPAEDPGHIPTVCPSIMAGLERGQPGFLQALAHGIHHPSGEGPAAFELVAENSTDTVIGAIVCAPPYKLIYNYAQAFPAQAQHTKVQGVLGLSKIVGVAVSEDFRGNGIGSELIQIARQIVKRCGIFVMHGSCSPHLTRFYKRLGFKVEPFEAPLDLWLVFGFPAFLSTPGMHVFSQRLVT